MNKINEFLLNLLYVVLLLLLWAGSWYLVTLDNTICAHGHKMVIANDGTMVLYKGILIPCE